MLKSITGSSSTWLNVNQYQNSPYISPGAQSAGMMRYNPSMSRVEVYDGNVWIEFGGTASVEFSYNATQVFEWAQKKMAQEAEFEELAKNNVAVRDSLNRLKEAESQLQVVTALVKEHNVAG